ncbi:MAG: methyltransferase domain-containing protein [Bacteroidales bacterium]|nr:methyltransferase domain-containing protein [Bacteroidales bacterium]
MGFYYRGNNVYCPYCGQSFKRMLPGGMEYKVIEERDIVGGGYRDNIVCPRCYSTDRDRLIYLYLNHKTSVFSQPIKLLHIAPEGPVRALLRKYNNIEYYTGDKFTEGYNDYYYDRDIIQMDITDIQYEDESFDAIICNHVLEHILNDRLAMSEIYRVMKPGGWAVLQVPIARSLEKGLEIETKSNKEREDLFGQFDHVRLYGLDYPKRLEQAGFKVNILNPAREQWPFDLKKYAINEEENLYVAQKL